MKVHRHKLRAEFWMRVIRTVAAITTLAVNAVLLWELIHRGIGR